ncbi:hypothetical protein C818_03728 [Lachnospiraceae bacterium MD308]|nr:hypothetical protein C818_03728 [Lachnospiraceae bacterium MD308]
MDHTDRKQRSSKINHTTSTNFRQLCATKCKQNKMTKKRIKVNKTRHRQRKPNTKKPTTKEKTQQPKKTNPTRTMHPPKILKKNLDNPKNPGTYRSTAENTRHMHPKTTHNPANKIPMANEITDPKHHATTHTTKTRTIKLGFNINNSSET